MTQPRQSGDAESPWQQPPFDPAAGQPGRAGFGGGLVVPPNSMGNLVPADRRPPSVLESILNVVSGVVWPVFVALSLFGIGYGWVGNVFAAIVASSLLRGIATELKRRRRYLPPHAGVVPPAEGDLR
ncbi:MAG: hypothetical protein ACOH1Y_16955 [Propionicimonas sp.]